MTFNKLDNKILFAEFLDATGLKCLTIETGDGLGQTVEYGLDELYEFAPLLVNDLKAAFEKEIKRCRALCVAAEGEREGLDGEA